MTSAMKNLIEVHGEKLTTTSLVISELFGRPHGNVLKSLDKLMVRGRVKFDESSYQNKQNKTQKMYVLDKRSFLISMPFIGGNKSEEGQVKLVDGFIRIETELNRLQKMRLTVDWQEARANSKCIRSTLTQVVQAYERLADKQGGLKGKPENRHYYSSITKRIYKELFGDSSLKEVRDKLDSLQLQFLSICEQSCADEIQRLVELEVEYHLIYQECVKRIIATVNGLSATRLSSKNQNIRLVWDKGIMQ